MQILIKQRLPSARRAVKGFTLVEMLIVVAIMAILLSLAVPSFNSTIRDNRVSSATNSLSAALAQARSEAVKRGKPVSICPSTTTYTACSTNGLDWKNGWLVYLEGSTANTTSSIDTTDTTLPTGIIATGSALTNVGVTLIGTGNTFVRFSPRGLLSAGVTAKLTFQMRPADSYGNSSVACAPTKANYLELEVGLVGRTSVTKKPC